MHESTRHACVCSEPGCPGRCNLNRVSAKNGPGSGRRIGDRQDDGETPKPSTIQSGVMSVSKTRIITVARVHEGWLITFLPPGATEVRYLRVSDVNFPEFYVSATGRQYQQDRQVGIDYIRDQLENREVNEEGFPW